ncbi:MAG: beta-L-arabinofuranosidase domain-containing protein, partial [Armatimonadota bacterium]
MPTDTPMTLVVDTTKSAYATQRPLPITAVKLTDTFWQPRREINRKITLPSQFKHLEETDRLNNFRRAAGRKDLQFVGIFFNDSDVYKWLEAASSALPEDTDRILTPMVETAIDAVAAAQEPDGYLNTYFTYEKAGDRWKNLKDMHELYCAGHLFQAAVAHYRATGSEKLLTVARRFADNIDSIFGAMEDGKRPGACGHPEAEMALVELARATGDFRYRDLAQHMVDVRGQKPGGVGSGSAYHQDHVPFRVLAEVTGHAVRMVYLSAGATDLYLESGEAALKSILDRQWDNRTQKRMYISGGLGSRHEGEAFGKDYELPNARAYTETCAAIGGVMWDWRMLLATGEAKYADSIEHTLINAVLPGLSLDGQAYFYPNPLEADATYRREPWFGCACCPPNVARLLAQLPGYFYTIAEDAITIHQYSTGTAQISLPDGRTVALRQETDYPWDGSIAVTTETPGEYTLRLRIPAWCEDGAALMVNGNPISDPLAPGTYAEIRRDW